MNHSRFHGMPCQGSRLPFAQLGLVVLKNGPRKLRGRGFSCFFWCARWVLKSSIGEKPVYFRRCINRSWANFREFSRRNEVRRRVVEKPHYSFGTRRRHAYSQDNPPASLDRSVRNTSQIHLDIVRKATPTLRRSWTTWCSLNKLKCMQGLQGNVANMGSMGGGDINFQFLVGGQQSRRRKLPRALQNTYKRKKPAKRDHGRLLSRAACGFAAPEEGIMVSTILDEMSPPERALKKEQLSKGCYTQEPRWLVWNQICERRGNEFSDVVDEVRLIKRDDNSPWSRVMGRSP